MTGRHNRRMRMWLRDMTFGATLFLLLPALAFAVANPKSAWSVTEAAAGEVMASRAVEVTAPPGAVTENAIVAAAQMRAASDPLFMRRLSDWVVLGLAFSLLVSFNLGFLRHLRRVLAVQSRQARRRHS